MTKIEAPEGRVPHGPQDAILPPQKRNQSSCGMPRITVRRPPANVMLYFETTRTVAGGRLEVAAIIPAYNSAHWLRPCIESILGQTYPITEIIVVDDGSQDNTKEVVESYGNAVRYYWRPNGGLSAARNTGVEQTTSPWIAFLDADDRWTPRKIELQVRALEANPQAVLCYTRMVLVSPDGAQQVGELTPPDRLWPILRYANQIAPSTVVMSRDAFLRAGRFDEELKACEDWDLWFRLGRQSEMVAVDEPVTL